MISASPHEYENTFEPLFKNEKVNKETHDKKDVSSSVNQKSELKFENQTEIKTDSFVKELMNYLSSIELDRFGKSTIRGNIFYIYDQSKNGNVTHHFPPSYIRNCQTGEIIEVTNVHSPERLKCVDTAVATSLKIIKSAIIYLIEEDASAYEKVHRIVADFMFLVMNEKRLGHTMTPEMEKILFIYDNYFFNETLETFLKHNQNIIKT